MSNTLLETHISEFLLFKASLGVTEKYIRKCGFGMRYFKQWLGDEPVTPLTLTRYLAYLHNQPISDWYKKTNAQVLKSCLNYLISAGYEFPTPTFKLPRIHRKKLCYLTPEEIKKLLKSDLTPRETLIIRLFISTGLRLNELCQLAWKDINFSTGAIEVKHGKGDKFRVVITDKLTLALLLRYRNQTGGESLTIFSLENMGVRSVIVRVRTKSGIYFTAHALRRTFARQAVINGMDIIWVQQLMGHSSIEMTQHYVQQLDTDDLIATYKKYAPLEF